MKNNNQDNNRESREKLKDFYEALGMNEIFKYGESGEEVYLEEQNIISSDSIQISSGPAMGFNNYNTTYPTQESWTECEQKKPNKSTAKEQIIKHYNTSFDYSQSDTLEVKFFKALVIQDQETVGNLIKSSMLDQIIKKTAIGICVNFAASSRDIDLIRFLIKNHIDVNNSYTHTEAGELHLIPLKLSIMTDDCNATFFDEELVQLFLDNGTDINVKTDDGNRSSSTVYAELIKFAPEEFLLNLLDKVLNVNETQLENISQNKTEKEYVVNGSYLLAALQAGKYSLVKALVKKGADVNFANHHGFTILDAALGEDNFEIFKFVIENGGNINHTGMFGCPVLGVVSLLSGKFFEQALELIKKYADLDSKINSGTIFSEIIIKTFSEDIAIKLLEQVKDLDVKIKDPFITFSKWNNETNQQEQYEPLPDCYFTLAIKNKNFKLAESLIHKGANIKFETEQCDLLWINIKQVISENNPNQIKIDKKLIDSIARFIVKTSKLTPHLDDPYYNNIKFQLDFEVKCEKDIKWLNTPHSFSNIVKMLTYYIKGYKEKKGTYKNQVGEDNDGFFACNALKVKDALKFHIKQYWHTDKTICKNLKDVQVEKYQEQAIHIIMPKPIWGIVGEILFEDLCKEIEFAGDSYSVNEQN